MGLRGNPPPYLLHGRAPGARGGSPLGGLLSVACSTLGEKKRKEVMQGAGAGVSWGHAEASHSTDPGQKQHYQRLCLHGPQRTGPESTGEAASRAQQLSGPRPGSRVGGPPA